MAVDAGPAPLAPTIRRPIPLRHRIYGLGSIYGKTLRDSRFAFLIMTGLIAGLMLAVGSAWSTAFGTAEARAEIVALVAAIPPALAGLAGPVVHPETMGGYLTYKYGPFFAFLAGLWSIVALSGTLAGEARRGSLDFVAAAPFGKRRIAFEKLSAHVTAMVISMVILAIATYLAGSVFGIDALGDAIPLEAAIGFAMWVGLIALVSGAVAFALAPIVGRGSAAGVAGIILLGFFVLGGYAPYVPAIEAIANISWFTWTYDHVPLAGVYDWPSLGLVAVVTIVLYALGIELFARRDLGVMTGLPVPGLPRFTLGLRGPVGRAFGDQLPTAIGWGLGIGFFGLMLATVSRTLADELDEFPTFTTFLTAVFPGVDLTSSGWFLQLVFVEMGLIVIGFAAASFVGKWASDETSGRLEVILAAPIRRTRWVVAGGIGALLAVLVSTIVFAVGIAIGSLLAGGDALTPTTGAFGLGFYGAAVVGIGFAIGGLLRTSWAAELAAAFVIVTFLVGLLAPALQLPEWVADLALTMHYGQPMVGIWDASGYVVSVLLAVVGIGLGAWGMSRRDVNG